MTSSFWLTFWVYGMDHPLHPLFYTVCSTHLCLKFNTGSGKLPWKYWGPRRIIIPYFLCACNYFPTLQIIFVRTKGLLRIGTKLAVRKPAQIKIAWLKKTHFMHTNRFAKDKVISNPRHTSYVFSWLNLMTSLAAWISIPVSWFITQHN